MKTLSVYVLFIVSSFIIFVSCQRELSPDPRPVSNGELYKDSNGTCQLIVITGVYSKEQNLTDSNYLEVDVNITSPGSYNITTDTINGYSFKANGVFANTGLVHIKLTGYGIPLIAGTDHFTVKYNESVCAAIVTVTDANISPAVFSLEGAPGICMNDTVYGSYIKDVPLDTNAKVKILVNVSVPGTYTITTNTINGYGFSAAGNFSASGVYPVFLTASGAPSVAGTDVFTVAASATSCTFPINVLTALTVNSNDYYPLSANSYWTYDDLVHTGDTLKETVVDSTAINNNLYKVMREDVRFGGPYQYFYRKSGSGYYEHAAPNKYTTFFQYKNPVNADILFLKENLNTGSGWETPEYIDTSSNGDIISLKYNFSCLDANASVILNRKAFINVYIIRMLPLVKLAGGMYDYTSEEYLFYYAKGIGLIYLKKTLSGFTQNEIRIRNWQVN